MKEQSNQTEMWCGVHSIFRNLTTCINKIFEAKDFVFLSKKHIHQPPISEKEGKETEEVDNQTQSFQQQSVALSDYTVGWSSDTCKKAYPEVTMEFDHAMSPDLGIV